MNERIKELAEQARKYVADAIELGFPQDQVDDIRDEKFAELIVQECCQKLENDGMVEVAMELKEHFGVKE